MKKYLFLLLLLSACSSKPDLLFFIEENKGHRSNFLFMAESTSVAKITGDSLQKYLTPQEIAATKPPLASGDTSIFHQPVFKHFSEIYRTPKYSLQVIFRDGNDSFGRDYQFLLRTYQPDWEIIDTHELAVWNKRKERYCFGAIDENLKILKYCDPRAEKEVFQLLENGFFVKSDQLGN